MFKLFRFHALTALVALSACAPARTTPAPSTQPVPVAPAPATADAPPAPEPDEALAASPDDWWLLDAELDRVSGTSVDRAYQELLAGEQPERTVVVAVIDSGVDIEHEDLDDNIWTNEDEIPGNDLDDDENGYVDDIHGWNFIGGPGGENVEHDTYEVTRLYTALRPRYEGANPDTLTEERQLEYERFREIEEEFQAERAEMTQLLEQTRAADMAVTQMSALLRQELGGDSLTAERVAALRPMRPEVQQAKQIYLQLAAAGITAEQIAGQREELEGRLQYGLDPSFDPRGIVGDDYADLTERSYGNPDVEGPDAGHGTHVAGIIAAERGNDIGVDGIAAAVRIMSIRAVPDGDERDKDIANAIRYAVDNGAHIINMSFGKAFSPQKGAVDEAIRYAEERGVLLVHAAGNDAADLDSEPNFPNRYYAGGGTAGNWIEVGASAQTLEALAAPFSNYSRERVDVFAPGVGILSTVPGNEYESNSGTSMAAPVVSGLAALLMAYYPDLSAAEVKQIILESATRYTDQSVTRPGDQPGTVRFGDLSTTGAVVNAYNAIRMAEERAGEERP